MVPYRYPKYYYLNRRLFNDAQSPKKARTMKTPEISVLMPAYNAERHLRPSIESVLGQTLGDFEFLLVDDGSTDSTLEIAMSYQDPRIRIIRNRTNEGISASLNKGIDQCAGRLIARMDADDISYPSRLKDNTTT